MHDDVPIPAALAYAVDPIPPDDLDAFVDWSFGPDGSTREAGEVVRLLAQAVADRDLDMADATSSSVAEPVRRWRIDDDAAAEWAMRHYAEATTAATDVQAQADEWVDRIRSWADEQTRRHHTRAAFFDAHLIHYAMRRRESTGKATLTLPSGKVTSRKQDVGGTVMIADEPVVIAWCKENIEPDDLDTIVETKERALVSQLRKVATVRSTPYAVVALSGCDHVVTIEGAAAQVVNIGVDVDCAECGTPRAIVACVETGDRMDVVDEADRIIPGTEVRPESVAYKVSPA